MSISKSTEWVKFLAHIDILRNVRRIKKDRTQIVQLIYKKYKVTHLIYFSKTDPAKHSKVGFPREENIDVLRVLSAVREFKLMS